MQAFAALHQVFLLYTIWL